MKLWMKVTLSLIILIMILVLSVGFWSYRMVRASLPRLEGELRISGLEAPVRIERDRHGVPSIYARSQEDAARALGFVHAQERFFQMDLMRRQPAGELAELLGSAVVALDRNARIHQLRSRAQKVVESASPHHRNILDAYTEGVNTGLRDLGRKPFEYFILQSEPAPWKREDSILAIISMFFTLNDESGRRESDFGLLYDLLPRELADFLAPKGTQWDAPIVGDPAVSDFIPGPEILDLRKRSAGIVPDIRPLSEPMQDWHPGSNNWAVAGSRTRDGRAIVADDMHLGLMIPNTWFRARLEWGHPGEEIRVTGVTLPGTPVVVVGSNEQIAWAFTNSSGDWVDLVVLEIDPRDPARYLTPYGYRRFGQVREEIRIRGEESETLEFRTTIWGPVIDEDHRGRPRALRWTAHDPDGVNVEHLDLVNSSSVQEAVEIAARSGIPPQNFVCADRQGRIAWTIEGRIPRRVGFDGKLPVSWADGSHFWDGYLEPSEYPRIINPESGMIWTANSRVVDGEMLARIGFGGYDLGARTRQIRDRLASLEIVTEADMLDIQLDDRALFLERWRGLLLDLLREEERSANPGRKAFYELIREDWTGRASVDSAGYRLVRTFRSFTDEKVFEWLFRPCREADDRFRHFSFTQREQPLWLLVTRRPLHLLDPGYRSWEEFLLAVVDETVEYFEGADSLKDHTWGERNTVRIRHPISRAIPFLASWLDMPPVQLPGDSNMPRFQGPSSGASERLAVSPGREADGYFHMPAGQSGHPMSSYYRAGHEDWVEGRPSSFLPGPAEKVLHLLPRD